MNLPIGKGEGQSVDITLNQWLQLTVHKIAWPRWLSFVNREQMDQLV